jgi:Mrp family chromosome partitioning ATPase
MHPHDHPHHQGHRPDGGPEQVETTGSSPVGAERRRLFEQLQREARERFVSEQGPIARALRGVRYKVAILSGKGGVGKSTATVNLAATLKGMGYKVVIFDADVHGPSIPKMLGAKGRAGVKSLHDHAPGEACDGDDAHHESAEGPGHGHGHGHGQENGQEHAPGHGHGRGGGCPGSRPNSAHHHAEPHSQSDSPMAKPKVDHHSFLFEPVMTRHGVAVISVASIWPTEETPVMWKGPHKMRAIRQFLSAADWGEADFLLIDLPPGTGDEVQTIMTAIPGLDGMLVITTPQGISRMVCSKAINCAKELRAPLLGLVENMGLMTCPHCGGHVQPFGRGRGERLARLMEIPFLGSVPFDAQVGMACDDGVPSVLADPEGAVAAAFEEVTAKLLVSLGEPEPGLAGVPARGSAEQIR